MVKVFLLFLFCIFHQLLCIAGSCPAIVSREQWRARNPETIDYVVFPLDIVIIQHTATGTCKSTETCKNLVRSIQNYHMDNVNFGDIGYNFLIGGDGKVYEGVLPTDAAIKAVKDLMACGVELEELTPDYKLFGAKQLSATESPGSELFNRMRNWDHFTEYE
ncbi:hypothetical protein RN001_012364 [Aquatica leii]|uniref:Uncharacterized protein n=1 Tax=Aquatica leii TaxID=1421715 RepID=A0AAN7SD96_9COLE|nr:hypothetical protein RN001_012364 [Aquatica leii]